MEIATIEEEHEGDDEHSGKENCHNGNSSEGHHDSDEESVSGRCKKYLEKTDTNHGVCSIYYIWGQTKKSN
jgi:hypothetical protein